MTPVDHPVSPVTAWPPTPGQRAPAALFVVTADHRVCAVNDTATAWFQPPRMLLPLSQFLGIADHDERVAELLALAADLKAHRQPREMRLTLRRADGESFAALLMTTPLADVEGSHLGFEAMLLDLSRWRDREALVLRTHEEDLAQQLQSTEHALGLLRREMEGFSQILGHDLRAPLRHAAGYLALLRERMQSQRDETSNEYLAGLQQATQRLGQMVEAMHDYVHLCRARLNVQPVPLAPLVHSIQARLPASHGATPIEWHIAPDLPTVQGDPMLLAEAMRHLLDNAGKFTRAVPNPVIRVGWSRTPHGSTEIQVEDNGVGFDRHHADKLFLLFQRQHHSTEYEGLGVGLAMAYRIVDRHGGRLFCEATPGGGCRVHFTLPDGRLDGPAPDPGG